jgi:hypothetical protein
VSGSLMGLGQTAPASCGTNPCDWTDDIWVSDACSAYLACAGLPPMTFSAQFGAGLEQILGGTASAIGQGVSGAVSNTATDAVLIVGAVIVGVVLFAVYSK